MLLYENGVAATSVRAADGSAISLVVRSRTRFPAGGTVDLAIEPSKAAEFTINFRVPDWAKNFSAEVGGKRYTAGAQGGLLTIRRSWSRGDRVMLSFAMPVEVLPGGLSYPNRVAIKRGPQVLALDKGLNAGIDSLGTVRYGQGSALADASAALPASWGWKEAFYLDAQVGNTPKKLVLVPFAEAGQKSAEVAVWITRGW
jgi:DUF1680 family protein